MEIEDCSKMTPAERDVAGYLDELGISYEFEYPVFVKDERGRPNAKKHEKNSFSSRREHNFSLDLL